MAQFDIHSLRRNTDYKRSEGLSFEAADLLSAGPAPLSEDHESHHCASTHPLLEAVRGGQGAIQGTLPDPDRWRERPPTTGRNPSGRHLIRQSTRYIGKCFPYPAGKARNHPSASGPYPRVGGASRIGNRRIWAVGYAARWVSS